MIFLLLFLRNMTTLENNAESHFPRPILHYYKDLKKFQNQTYRGILKNIIFWANRTFLRKILNYLIV